MTKADQKRIIRELCSGMRGLMLENVHKVPANWDGRELRQWFADLTNNGINYAKMDRQRLRDYNDDRLERNI